MCVCVCVCERERERERDRKNTSLLHDGAMFFSLHKEYIYVAHLALLFSVHFRFYPFTFYPYPSSLRLTFLLIFFLQTTNNTFSNFAGQNTLQDIVDFNELQDDVSVFL